MNPILLSHWLPICDRAQLAYIPATIGPKVKIDEIYRFLEGLGDTPTLDRAYLWLRQHYQPRDTMWRWDCCSTETLKSTMAQIYPTTLPTLEFELDEPRFIAVLEELERSQETSICVLLRPWVKAKLETNYPVEFRAFAFREGIAVSSYYTRRPLPVAYQETAVQVRRLTEQLAAHTPIPSFSADFLLAEDGNLLFLEGGLGFTRGGLVNPCCFDGEPPPGAIALCSQS
ncbi:hypothetical protein [Scytonema sp. NUACC26]|uniref:hypothetical protein n=1 Tax=Scytonema sp. NUACC26 TaxID=3140176 RepID=UPI0034DB8F55